MEGFLNQTTSFLQTFLLNQNSVTSISSDYFKYLQFIPLFFFFFVVTLLLKPLIGRFATKLDAIDLPASMRKEKLNKFDQTQGVKAIHENPTPLLGGVAVIAPILLLTPFFFESSPIVIPFLIAVAILFIVGILDDIYNLPAHFQLTGQLVAALIIAISIIDIPFINNPFGGVVNLNWYEFSTASFNQTLRFIIPGDIILIAWVLLCTNAVKWIGGIGGLLESNAFIAFMIMFILGIREESAFIAVMAIAFAGGIAGGWIFDFPPSKIFTGSTGKTLYGFIIATLALVNGAKVAATIIVLALPLIDALYVLVYRYINFKPKNLVDLMRINGPMHLHHQLYSMNFTPRQILLIESSISVFFGMIAVLTTGAYKFFLLLTIAFISLVGIILLNNRAKKRRETQIEESAKQTPESKYSY